MESTSTESPIADPSAPADCDHVVYLVPDVDAAVDRLEDRLGVRPRAGGRHARWGTRNALLALGPRTYFEILGPDPDRADRGRPVGFGLDGAEAPRLALWAVRADDLDARAAVARRRGVGLGEIFEGSRERPDGTVLWWRLTDPETVVGDGLVPFLIEWGTSVHPATDAPGGCTLVELRGEHPEPERIRPLLEAVGASLRVVRAPQPRLIVTLQSPNGRVTLG